MYYLGRRKSCHTIWWYILHSKKFVLTFKAFSFTPKLLKLCKDTMCNSSSNCEIWTSLRSLSCNHGCPTQPQLLFNKTTVRWSYDASVIYPKGKSLRFRTEIRMISISDNRIFNLLHKQTILTTQNLWEFMFCHGLIGFSEDDQVTSAIYN